MRTAGVILLLIVAAGALGAPWLSPNDPNARFEELLYPPPTPVHLSEGDEVAQRNPSADDAPEPDAGGSGRTREADAPVSRPHIHPLRVLSLRGRTLEEDPAEPAFVSLVRSSTSSHECIGPH